MPNDPEPYDALARAMMATRPELDTGVDLYEWLASNREGLSRAELVAAEAILMLHEEKV